MQCAVNCDWHPGTVTALHDQIAEVLRTVAVHSSAAAGPPPPPPPQSTPGDVLLLDGAEPKGPGSRSGTMHVVATMKELNMSLADARDPKVMLYRATIARVATDATVASGRPVGRGTEEMMRPCLVYTCMPSL